jgi:hypothetical protein
MIHHPKKLFFPLLSAGGIFLLAACSLSSPSGSPSGSTVSGPCGNPLYPVAVGNSWNYDMTGTTTSTFTRSIQAVDSGGFTDQDVFSGGTTRTGKWNCAAGALTNLDPVGDTTANVQFNGHSSDFQTTALNGVTLPAHVAAGDTWNQTLSLHGSVSVNGVSAESTSDTTIACTAAGTENVSVPAGSFDAMKVTCQDQITITVTTAGISVPTALSFTTDSWYAPGVGWVKSVSSGSSVNTTIVLTSYTLH